MHSRELPMLKVYPELPSPCGHLHTHLLTLDQSHCSQLGYESVLYTFLILRICVRFLLLGHLITLVYWLFTHLCLILNCKFQAPLASSQALSSPCPVAHSQSTVFLSHQPYFNYSGSLPTSRYLYTFQSLKEQLYLLLFIITLQNFIQVTDYLTGYSLREIVNKKRTNLI